MSRTQSAMLAAVAVALALAIPASASSPLQSLSLAKTCNDQGVCTVFESDAAALPPGTTETYSGPQFGDPVLSSRVVIASPYSGGGTAVGHCTWPLRSLSGTCTFAEGAGSLAGFHANLTVTANDGFTVFYWNGTYRL